jgi:hypothetical protein
MNPTIERRIASLEARHGATRGRVMLLLPWEIMPEEQEGDMIGCYQFVVATPMAHSTSSISGLAFILSKTPPGHGTATSISGSRTMRDLVRRLSTLERAHPVVREPLPMTDERRAGFIALQALVVAIMLGEMQDGEDSMQAVFRGIERAHAASDRVSNLRYGFARRLDHARCIALNGSDSVAVPRDWFEQSTALLRHPLATEAMPSFLSLYFEHPDFTWEYSDTERMTVIGGDGLERHIRSR